MKEVKVKLVDLLKTVTKNRETHRDLFLKAQDGFREIMIQELERSLKDAREGREIRRSVAIPAPADHTSDYDRVIKMLEMSVEETVVLQAHEFEQYVMDNWAWKRHATGTNVAYSNKMVPSSYNETFDV
jgi:hypothetical protein